MYSLEVRSEFRTNRSSTGLWMRTYTDGGGEAAKDAGNVQPTVGRLTWTSQVDRAVTVIAALGS